MYASKRQLWNLVFLGPFSMMICHITYAMEKTSYNWYKLSDDNVIGGKRCFKTRGELNNLSESNLKDWMRKGRNCFQGGGDLDDVTTLPLINFL